MNIETITIRGFRCFSEIGVTISLDHLTCFIGPNASGKTATMMALARIFGETRTQRQIVPSDFHLPVGERLKDKSSRTLLIECHLAFPELEDEGVANTVAVPETFNQMVVDEPGGTPYCRIRLEANWTDDGTTDGDINQIIWWILTPSNNEKVIEENRRRVQSGDRGKIRVVYVPAAREPDQQIRSTTATSFGRLLQALTWDGADEALKEKLSALQRHIEELSGIQTMNTEIQKAWDRFYDGRVARDVVFQALEEDPASLVKLLVPTFRPGEDGCSMVVSDLSDGLRSLFSLSLSLGLFRVEELLRGQAVASGFKAEIAESLPMLTIFAVEEPENHLSPQYLGRVVGELLEIGKDDRAQVIMSSHSPSILSRVLPDHVRYFLGHEHVPATQVVPIPLPEDKTDEAFKYVREAVRGFPELYFARLVILGEGPSEVIILKRLFEANGTPLDTHFISVVPLGGRHVNHFWRLLQGLGTPYLTLLDLDREKEGAGWGRVQYVRDQLVLRLGAGHESLRFKTNGGATQSLEDEAYETLGEKSDTEDMEDMAAWLEFFEDRFDVFFSAPLDLDFAMLEVFQTVYKGLAPAPKGPRLPPKNTAEYKLAIIRRLRQVLASDDSNAPDKLGSTFTEAQQELFPWYKYLFVDGSKPVAHMRALLAIEDKILVKTAPIFLRELVKRAHAIVSHDEGTE